METSAIRAQNSSTSRTGYGSTTFNIIVEGNIMSSTATTATTTITTSTSATTRTTTATSEETIETTRTRTSKSTGYQPFGSQFSLSTSSSSSSNSRESVYSITEINKLIQKPGVEASSRLLKMQIDIKSRALDKSNKTFLAKLEFVLNVVNHMIIGFITIYMTWLCLRIHLKGTALHAWLVTLGFQFLMAEALMCYYNNNILTGNFHRNTKTLLHWVFQLIGGGLGIAGVLIKCIQKGFQLQSTHGILGFIAFTLCCFSLISGLVALYSMKLKKRLSPLLNKTFHNLLGLVTFCLALTSQYYGYETGFFSRNAAYDFSLLMKSLTLSTLILSSLGPLKSLYYKCNNILKQYL